MKYNKVSFGLQFDFQFLCVFLSIFLGHIIFKKFLIHLKYLIHIKTVPSSSSGLIFEIRSSNAESRGLLAEEVWTDFVRYFL